MKRPKRPLTAYNLFYRFKRDKILRARKNGDESAETVSLIAAVPGLEEHPTIANTLSPQKLNEFRRNEIRAAMKDNIEPKCNRHRSHRKTHGALSFLEMSKHMVASWKSADKFSRSVFDELAEEGRKLYRERVAEYEEVQPARRMVKMRNEVESPTHSKKRRVDVTISVQPEATTGNLLPVMSGTMLPMPKRNRPESSSHVLPASTALTQFDCRGLEPPEPLPVSSSIFELEERRDGELISAKTNSSSINGKTEGISSPDGSRGHSFLLTYPRPLFPYMERREYKRRSTEVSVNDIMELIATLDERMTG
eukprot:CAMPEP_0183753386 /NCGR_PEP_ID=MMETSP0739-20130205/2906_1 /TAXON_ID=385413 /ORGANISM="Thalassiosira miniscula, Strain CCMP1093" /LENGTH=308 /DNA_ID=CAMNT_0025989863 /DNA_START=198 /DNA_END=1124 /DNA_ORIENTATION=-